MENQFGYAVETSSMWRLCSVFILVPNIEEDCILMLAHFFIQRLYSYLVQLSRSAAEQEGQSCSGWGLCYRVGDLYFRYRV